VPQLTIDGVLDVDEASETIPFTYSITSYGADFPVDALVRRVRAGDIFIPLFSASSKKVHGVPRFQREYVWKKQQADRFIESLLLGLPVPGIFLVKEISGRHLVLDGHQRLLTLLRFYTNEWNEGPFELAYVQKRFVDRSFETLEPTDRRRLMDSIIHATIVRQDDPKDDLSSVYLIFERLNSGGTSLQPQEIRVALYHGPFVELLKTLNAIPSWRQLVGKRSARLKDVELILRFFALLEGSSSYRRPMKSFLNAYANKRRDLPPKTRDDFASVFTATADAILNWIGPRAFRPQRSVNAALVDALMVGVARRLARGPLRSPPKRLRAAYSHLLRTRAFVDTISRSTADDEYVRRRLKLATTAFATLA
jgi:hypothetical protein